MPHRSTILVLIEEIEILNQLYERIVLPEAVLAELIDEGATPEVRGWAMRDPDWVEVRNAPPHESLLSELDAGEAAAIAMAQSEANVLLLIDEKAGRLEATRRGIQNMGTLGVLRRAAIENLIDLPSVLEKLPPPIGWQPTAARCASLASSLFGYELAGFPLDVLTLEFDFRAGDGAAVGLLAAWGFDGEGDGLTGDLTFGDGHFTLRDTLFR